MVESPVNLGAMLDTGNLLRDFGVGAPQIDGHFLDLSIIDPDGVQSVNSLNMGKMPVETQLILDKDRKENGGCQSERQPGYVSDQA